MITRQQEKKLIRLARKAYHNAHAPYSGYQVGAAVLTAGGAYYSGCNIENAALTTTTHAEGNALAAAVAAGERKFVALALVNATDPPAFPCAICRQSLAEFDRGEMLIIASNLEGKVRKIALAKLYPHMFGAFQLGSKPAKF